MQDRVTKQYLKWLSRMTVRTVSCYTTPTWLASQVEPRDLLRMWVHTQVWDLQVPKSILCSGHGIPKAGGWCKNNMFLTALEAGYLRPRYLKIWLLLVLFFLTCDLSSMVFLHAYAHGTLTPLVRIHVIVYQSPTFLTSFEFSLLIKTSLHNPGRSKIRASA